MKETISFFIVISGGSVSADLELAGAVGVKRDSSRHEEEVQVEETQSAGRGRRRPLGDLKWLHGMLEKETTSTGTTTATSTPIATVTARRNDQQNREGNEELVLVVALEEKRRRRSCNCPGSLVLTSWSTDLHEEGDAQQ